MSLFFAPAALMALADAAFVADESWRRWQSLAGGIGAIAMAFLFSPVGRGRARVPLAIVGASLCLLAATARLWR